MADDLRAEIEALRIWTLDGSDQAPGAVVVDRDEVLAILAAHLVQGEVTFETNLLDPVWLTTSSGRRTTRTYAHPVQVTTAEESIGDRCARMCPDINGEHRCTLDVTP